MKYFPLHRSESFYRVFRPCSYRNSISGMVSWIQKQVSVAFCNWCSSGAYEQPHTSQLMKGERCTIERPLFISSANFQLINICLHRIKKVRFYLHTLTSQQKIHRYRVEYITLFCNGFTDARATPKRKASGSNPLRDITKSAKVVFQAGNKAFALFWSVILR